MQKHLQKDIDNLKNKIITMGSAIEDRVYKASLAIINRDIRLAEEVIQADEEIDKMVKDSKEHAAEDKKRREMIDAKNAGDQLIYQTEKNLKEYYHNEY